MDRSTQRELERIGRSIPKEFLDNLYVDERDELEERLDGMAKDRRYSKRVREVAARAREETSQREKKKVLNPAAEQKISSYLDYAIRESIASGRLKKDALEDEWAKRIIRKTMKR